MKALLLLKNFFSAVRWCFVCLPFCKNKIISISPFMLQIVPSLLSEEAVLGYEYGVSTENPNRLVVWESQFGDFFTGAQVPVDTLVMSGEGKKVFTPFKLEVLCFNAMQCQKFYHEIDVLLFRCVCERLCNLGLFFSWVLVKDHYASYISFLFESQRIAEK